MATWNLDPITLTSLLLIALGLIADVGLLIVLVSLQRVFSTAPTLAAAPTAKDSHPLAPGLTVVIPAYNEARNIERCLSSVLRSDQPAREWQVIVVDDDSSDATASLAEATAHAYCSRGASVAVIAAGPRPEGEHWVGKNWACSRAMEQVTSDWVLFIDADVSLHPQTLRRAMDQAIREEADLFSLAPRLVCSCLAEWMVQPIMASLLGLGFPIREANDPNSEVAFAAGPFMLFRRHSYEAIGGHRGLAGEVVEDLALARKIKCSGKRLRYCLGLDAVDLQMYADFPSLWEGWSKNWFLGLDRNVVKALGAGAVVVLMFTTPWALIALAGMMPVVALPTSPQLVLEEVVIATGLVGISLQLSIRLWTRQQFGVPITYWWLMGVGGLIVGAIAPTSVWRSLTGRGWTWKGRSLAPVAIASDSEI